MADWSRWAGTLASPLGAAAAETDIPWKLRYGVGPTEKYAMAVTGQIPGAQPIRSDEDVDREERRASGYLFAKQHPTIAQLVQPGVDSLRANLFMDKPGVIAAAQEGQSAALGPPQKGWKTTASKVIKAGIDPSFETWADAANHFFGKR